MTTLEPKDSRSTLVEEVERERTRNGTPHPLPPSPLSPIAPFSTSFDLNAPLPPTPQSPALVRNIAVRDASDAWNKSIASSLNALANQFAAASQTLAALPAATDGDDDSTSSAGGLGAVQQAQTRLEQELESLREQVARLGENSRRSEKEKEREGLTVTDEVWRDNIETRFLGIEKKLDDLAETIRLDQARLYARLQNSTITSNKQTLFAVPLANGKSPQYFPATKGEFEHLTKERYEALLKLYGVPLKGDTAAKRQTLREFIGLSSPSSK